MGQFVLTSNFGNTTSTATVSSSDASGFPASNVNLYARPYRRWRSGAAITTAGAATGNANRTYVGLDFGSATALVAVMVDGINITSVLVQRSTDGATWTTDATVTVAQDGKDGRYKFYQVLTSWNYRYLRLNANTTTTTNGLTTMEVGSIVAIVTAPTWAVNAAAPYEAVGIWPHLPNDEGVGFGRRPVLTGNRRARISMSSSAVPSTMETSFDALAAISPATPFLFYRNFNSTAECYMVYRTSEVIASFSTPTKLELRTLIFEGVD